MIENIRVSLVNIFVYFIFIVNRAGIPAVAIPIRLSDRGLPLSLQLMGPKYSEKYLLTAAKWIENQVNFPFFQYVQTH